MRYNPYIDAKRKMEVIKIKHDLGKGTKEIAEDMAITMQSVSYYKAKMGLTRPKLPAKNRIPVCIVCRRNTLSDVLPHVCNDPACVAIFLKTMECANSITARYDDDSRPTPVDSDTKIAIDIQRRLLFSAPEGAKVCMLHGVTRLLSSLADHILFHKYHQYTNGPRGRPPKTLWKDMNEYRLYKMHQKDKKYAQRDMYSERPNPRRPRFAR